MTKRDAKKAAAWSWSAGFGNTFGFYGGCLLWAAVTYGYWFFYDHCKNTLQLSQREFTNYVSWTIPAAGTVGYLMMVILGPRLITSELTWGGRLKDVMITYNLYQVLCNSWWCAAVLWGIYERGQPLAGAELDGGKGGFNLAFLIYFHYNNKYLEFFDTVFMVLRAKHNQITFLHTYHHCIMTWAWYGVIKQWAGGDMWFGAWANSFIHVLMYGYYLMTALGLACPWKKVMTQMQLAQFCIVILYTLFVWGKGTAMDRFLWGYLDAPCANAFDYLKTAFQFDLISFVNTGFQALGATLSGFAFGVPALTGVWTTVGGIALSEKKLGSVSIATAGHFKSVPAWVSFVQIYVMSNMFVLFRAFYAKAYRAKALSKEGGKKKVGYSELLSNFVNDSVLPVLLPCMTAAILAASLYYGPGGAGSALYSRSGYVTDHNEL